MRTRKSVVLGMAAIAAALVASFSGSSLAAMGVNAPTQNADLAARGEGSGSFNASALAGLLGSGYGARPHGLHSFNGGQRSGAAAAKRHARAVRSVRARSHKHGRLKNRVRRV